MVSQQAKILLGGAWWPSGTEENKAPLAEGGRLAPCLSQRIKVSVQKTTPAATPRPSPLRRATHTEAGGCASWLYLIIIY